MINNSKLIKSLLIFLIVLPVIFISGLFIPDVQKYLIKNQLTPWVSDANVNYIHITPFSIRIDSLAFRYEAFDINIDHLEGHFSPFSLFEQRIKIEKFIVSDININDSSITPEDNNQSAFFFPGLFPYLDTGFIYDIGQLDIKAHYHSLNTGPVEINLAAQTINENTDNPLKLTIHAKDLSGIPDIQGIIFDSSINLQQHSTAPINAKTSLFNIKLLNHEGSEQDIAIQLAMKQLPKPNRWDSFPFDKYRNHYLQELLHPESIDLTIKHSSYDKLLSEIQFKGQYNGNEGIISGSTKIQTDKDFLQSFKTLKLPKVESSLSATFRYNTRVLEGYINLIDNFNIENYTSFVVSDSDSSKASSLPAKITLSNHLIASINEDQLVINSLLLNIFNNGQDYIKILTHKPISVDLQNLPEFLEQTNSDLMSIDINKLPLSWFNDFIPEHTIKNGIIDADINLAIDNQTLKLTSNRPVNLNDITVIKNIKTVNMAEIQEDNDSDNSKKKNKDIASEEVQTLLANQNLETDFIVTINKDNLNATINKLNIFQKDKDSLSQQAFASLIFNLKNPLADNALKNPVSAEIKGYINIHALLKTPIINNVVNNILNETSTSLSQSLPKPLTLNYKLSLKGESSLWKINNSQIELSQLLIHKDVTDKEASKKKIKKSIFQLKNIQDIHLKQEDEQIKLITSGQLLSAQINQFNLNWLSPFVQQFAKAYQFSGHLNKLDLMLSTQDNNNLQIDVNQLTLSQLESKKEKKTIFKKININSKLIAIINNDKISIRYPFLTIKKSNTHLIKNSGQITINHPGDEEKQAINVNGKLNGSISHIMNLGFIKEFTSHKLTNQSLLDAQYSLAINNKKITVNKSKFQILHPESKGELILTTLKPISLALNSNKRNFSQNGHLSFELNNFDLKPYESIVPDLGISFEHANGHFELLQTSKKQQVILKEPFKIQNIHFKDPENLILNPFNIILDFSARQNKNIIQGEIKQLSIDFIHDNDKEKAFELQTLFKLDLDKKIPVSELNGKLKLIMTQWLNQPSVMPDNTLSQGTLSSNFSINEKQHIKHQWLINNLVDNKGEKIVESIAIDGTGQLESLSSFKLTLPIIMKSISGQSNLSLNTHTTLNDKKKISMAIDGQEVFLNDLLKLLATINPQSELAQIESDKPENEPADNTASSDNPQSENTTLDNTPAEKPFWQSGFDITSQLKINKLFYTDYMSYHDIAGELIMNDQQLHAKDFKIKFHDSPMQLNAYFDFNEDKKRPYDIKLNTSLSEFAIGEFLTELNPQHVPRADGVFDVDINIYGGLSNLSQFRNELLFDINIEGRNGVYHLIPANDVMMRSSGAAMAVVGEIVSVLPTSGFGLGIVNRVIRFAKDIDYDFIQMHLVRQNDLNTNIESFQILSPELRVYATGGLTFKEDTRLFDQSLEMTANMNLAGEGAAIFYGLGLLNNEQDEYGFWKGPVINFSGTLNHQNDNFDEIISKAKSGTLAGGITNPFSGLVGNFKYRWFDNAPDYSHFNKTASQSPITTTLPPASNKPKTVKKAVNNASFFDETF